MHKAMHKKEAHFMPGPEEAGDGIMSQNDVEWMAASL